jgi:predicted ATPase/class 3 adenylate cyclase
MGSLPTGTVTFLFTDIEGSTRLLDALGADYDAELAKHREIIRTAVAAHGGLEVSTEGDAIFAVFPGAVEALVATARAQRALADQQWRQPLLVRMGLHTGQARLSGRDYIGMDVLRAARIAAAAHGGQVFLSDTTRPLVERGLPAGLALRDVGRHRLKDLPEPEHLHQLVIADLPDDERPPRSLETPSNLPQQLTGFFGREQELVDARVLLDASRLVTLTGPGGTGKTRLALEIASVTQDSFPDGSQFVPLAALREAELVMPAVAKIFGVSDGEQFERRLAEAIGSHQVLVVLDNFEQLLPAAPEVAELLADTSHLKLLVTSRSRLDVRGEREFPVAPLPVPDPRHAADTTALARSPAIALFVDRARAVRPDFELTASNASAVVEICARLDGLPLAIELAAARVRLLPPDAISARLHDSLGLLATTSRDVTERQRTLRGAILWSYDLLSDNEGALFRRLAVFLGGAPLAIVATVLRMGDELALLDELGALIDKSLLRPASDSHPDDGALRVEMLETIREFAFERLTASEEGPEYRERHALAYAALADEAEPQLTGGEGARWLNRLEREHANIRAAFSWAIETSRADVAIRITAATWRFMQMRGHLTEGRERAEQAIRIAAALADASLHARGLLAAGSFAYWATDFAAARRHYQAALDLQRAAGNRLGVAEALYNLSFAYFVPRDDPERGMELAEEALAMYREMDDLAGVAKTLWALGGIANVAAQPRTEAARAYFTESRDLFEALGDHTMLAWAHFMHAGVEARAGNVADAREAARAALRIFVELGDISGYALGLKGLAALEWFDGRRQTAARLAGAADRIARTTGVSLADWTSGTWRDEFTGIQEDPELAQAWTEGQTLELEEAVAEASRL